MAEADLGLDVRGGLEVAEAANVLARLGLVTAYGHVSARAGEAMLITPAADLADVTASQVIAVPLTATPPLPAGVPAEAWAHLALYRARPDAAAIARAQPASGLAAAASPPRSTRKPRSWCLYALAVPVPSEAATFRATSLPCRWACCAVMPHTSPGRVRSGTAAQSPHA